MVKKTHIHPHTHFGIIIDSMSQSDHQHIASSVYLACLFPSGSVPQHLPQGLCNGVKMVSHLSFLNFTLQPEKNVIVTTQNSHCKFVNGDSKPVMEMIGKGLSKSNRYQAVKWELDQLDLEDI